MRFDEELLSAYLDDELSPEQRKQVEVELESSPTLKRRMAELRSVRALVKKLPRAALERSSMEEIWKRIERIKREGQDAATNVPVAESPTVSVSPKKEPTGRWAASRWGALAAVAAGLAFVIAPIARYSFSEPESFVAFDSSQKQRTNELSQPTSSPPMALDANPQDPLLASKPKLNLQPDTASPVVVLDAAPLSPPIVSEPLRREPMPAPKVLPELANRPNRTELAKAGDALSGVAAGDLPRALPPGVVAGSAVGGSLLSSPQSGQPMVNADSTERFRSAGTQGLESSQVASRPVWYWIDSQLLANVASGRDPEEVKSVGEVADQKESVAKSSESMNSALAENASTRSDTGGIEVRNLDMAGEVSSSGQVVAPYETGTQGKITEPQVSPERLRELTESAIAIEYELNVEALSQVVALAEQTDSRLLAMSVDSPMQAAESAEDSYGLANDSIMATANGAEGLGRRVLDHPFSQSLGGVSPGGFGAGVGNPSEGSQPGSATLQGASGGMPGEPLSSLSSNAVAKDQRVVGRMDSADGSRPGQDSESGVPMPEEQIARASEDDEQLNPLKLQANNDEAKKELLKSDSDDATRGLRGALGAEAGAPAARPRGMSGAGSGKSSAAVPPVARFEDLAAELPRSETRDKQVPSDGPSDVQPSLDKAEKSAASDPANPRKLEQVGVAKPFDDVRANDYFDDRSKENHRIVLLITRSRWDRISQLLADGLASEGGDRVSRRGRLAAPSPIQVELGSAGDAQTMLPDPVLAITFIVGKTVPTASALFPDEGVPPSPE